MGATTLKSAKTPTAIGDGPLHLKHLKHHDERKPKRKRKPFSFVKHLKHVKHPDFGLNRNKNTLFFGP
ncbi:MAG: hypothetical protein ACI30R_01660, partial [Sodaliphilus sp.]